MGRGVGLQVRCGGNVVQVRFVYVCVWGGGCR